MAASSFVLIRGLMPVCPLQAAELEREQLRDAYKKFLPVFMEETQCLLGDAEIKQEGQLGVAGRALLRELYISLGPNMTDQERKMAPTFASRLADIEHRAAPATPQPNVWD